MTNQSSFPQPDVFVSGRCVFLFSVQSLLCGPSLEVSSILPLLEQLSDSDPTGLSIHLLCATKLGQHETSINRLLDRCPEAIISYANHELQNHKLVSH